MRTTVALAIAAALLAGTILVERRHASTDQQRAGRARLLPRFDRHLVRRVTITRAGVAPFSLERDPGAGPAAEAIGAPAWQISPGKTGDEAAIEELLAELDFAEIDREADLAPAAAGLAPPAVAIDVDLGGAPVAVRLGRPDASGRGVFVLRPGGDRVEVGPRRLLDLADRDQAAFRDHRALLIKAGAGDLSLRWSRGGPGPAVDGRGQALHLESGRWQNEQRQWVSGERVEEALRKLAELRVERFVAPPRDPPPPDAKLELGGPVRWTLLARARGCDSDDVTLVDRAGPRDSDWFCVSADLLRAAWRALDAAHARDGRLVASAPEAVAAIELSGDDRRITLRREHGRWRFVEPASATGADDEAVAAWLGELGRVRTAPSPAPGPATPVVRHLGVTGPRFTEALEISAARGATLAIHRAGEPDLASAPASLLALLDPDPLRFRDRSVLDLARFDARELHITSPAGARHVVKGDGEAWRVVAPAGAALDGGALDRLLSALTNLRALRFVAPATTLAPEVTLDLVEQPPGAASPVHHLLALGPRRPDGCLAALEQKGARTTFVLAPSVCDDLRVEVRSPGRPPR